LAGNLSNGRNGLKLRAAEKSHPNVRESGEAVVENTPAGGSRECASSPVQLSHGTGTGAVLTLFSESNTTGQVVRPTQARGCGVFVLNVKKALKAGRHPRRERYYRVRDEHLDVYVTQILITKGGRRSGVLLIHRRTGIHLLEGGKARE